MRAASGRFDAPSGRCHKVTCAVSRPGAPAWNGLSERGASRGCILFLYRFEKMVGKWPEDLLSCPLDCDDDFSNDVSWEIFPSKVQ